MIDPDRCQMWTRWAKERGFKRVALITENTDYGVGLVDETKKAFASMYPGAELKTIIFDRAVVDLTPQLLEIKNWKPDVAVQRRDRHADVPDRQAGLGRGADAGGADAHLLRRAVAAGVLEEPRREGQLRLVHRLLPPDDDA